MPLLIGKATTTIKDIQEGHIYLYKLIPKTDTKPAHRIVLIPNKRYWQWQEHELQSLERITYEELTSPEVEEFYKAMEYLYH